jgi:hypothetical protein
VRICHAILALLFLALSFLAEASPQAKAGRTVLIDLDTLVVRVPSGYRFVDQAGEVLRRLAMNPSVGRIQIGSEVLDRGAMLQALESVPAASKVEVLEKGPLVPKDKLTLVLGNDETQVPAAAKGQLISIGPQRELPAAYDELTRALVWQPRKPSKIHDAMKAGLAKLERRAKWKVSSGENPQLRGCTEDGKNVPLQMCEDELPVTWAWKGNPAACHRATQEGAVIRPVPDDECIQKLGGMNRLFTDFTETQCGLFTADFVFVRYLQRADCTLTNLCANPRTGGLTRYATDALGQVTQALVGETLEEKKQAVDRAPKRSRVSFRELILAGRSDALMVAALGESCFAFIKKVYESGKTLSSKAVVDASYRLKKQEFRSGEHNFDFFHYTQARSMLDQFHPEIKDREKAHAMAVDEDAYSKMLLFVRNGQGAASSGEGAGSRVLYVAEDPKSSRSFGPMRVRFMLGRYSRAIYGPEALPPAMQELERRFPGFTNACPTMKVAHYPVWSNAFIAIAEDSGIDIIHYLNTRKKGGWFQLVNPEIIRETELCYRRCK